MDVIGDWVALVDAAYPERDAADWDASGLQVGDPAETVSRVLVCLDVTSAVLDEAADRGADLLLAHHPLLFQPLRRLTPGSAAGRLALRAAREQRGVLAAHTNLDVAVPGTSEPILELLGVHGIEPIQPQPERGSGEVKLVTFVPADHTEAVLEALSGAGAGVIGEYDLCSFRVAGTGTFRPSQAADPTSGERGKLNLEPEDRIEVVVPRRRLEATVAALWSSHPYEEVAYDVYPLVAAETTAKGLGRVGALDAPRPLAAIAEELTAGLPAPYLRAAGDPDRLVRRVAACGGAGDRLIDAAVRAGAEVYITGDLRHHPVVDGLTQGLALVDAGHAATEAAALPRLAEQLRTDAAQRGLGAEVLASEVGTEPWTLPAPPR